MKLIILYHVEWQLWLEYNFSLFVFLHACMAALPDACFFPNRSVKQRQDILTNKLAANTHVIAGKTQIAQSAAVNNWGDTWNIIRW